MTRRRREPRTWGQRLVLLASTGLAVALLATAGGLGYAYAKYSRLARVELGTVLTERSSSSAPQNFLLVGVDSAANLDASDPARRGRSDVGGLRSDTIMILRVDPASERASLLSLPRDLWVPLASGGNQRINAAIEAGGPEVLIDTIEEYLGIPINHYVQVDFAGFRDLVAVIDGVEVYFENAARDRNSGLNVEQPGCVMLDPEQALAYVRARHYQTFEGGRWRTDPTGDLGRISRQQDFIVRALRRAVDKGIRNPVTLDNLVDAALDTVTVDDLLNADDIVDLASRFRGFDPDLLDLYALPVTDDTIGGAAVLRLVDTRAQPVLDLFRGTDAAALTPDGVRVKVLNGSGRPGEAGRASDALVAAGFTSAGTGEAESFDISRTVVRYEAGQAAAADLVARYLDGGAALEQVEGPVGADVVVVTGADFTGVRATPVPSTSSSVPPSSSPTGESSSTTTTSASTTTSSVIGQVPQPPPGSGC
jgi:LCP family protein required for cell wall assembly